LVESALGVVNLKEIATASPRLEALIFGAEDFASSIGAIRTLDGEEVAYGRAAVVTHAKAFGLQAIDTPYIDLNNLEGLAEASRHALGLGYDGKLAIHPKHVPIILQAFMPSESEIAHAEALVAAHNAHQQSGTGVFAFEGKMVDMPIIRAAEAILARAGHSNK
jgi:citrate lyase beta subunit